MTSLTALPAATAPPSRSRQRGPDTPAAVACHYAGDPAARPHCTLTAEVRLGPVTLCGSCAAARSTLGKGIIAAALPPGPAIDVLDWVTDADASVRQARRELHAAVTRARTQGRSWTQIAARLGITRQAAQQRFSAGRATGLTRGDAAGVRPVTANQRTTRP